MRGVAQAQTEFNKDQLNKPQPLLLEIIIANDENEPEIAKKIAKKIINKKRVIAVIGHNSSEATEVVLPEYKKVGLAVIGATATSTELSSDNFFRIPSSNKVFGDNLAKYAKEKMNLEKSEGATRRDVLEKLNEFKKSEYLRKEETSGEQLCFDSKGDSNRYARIRKVVNGTLQKIEGEQDQEAESCPLNKFQ